MHDCCSAASFYESMLFCSRMHHFSPLLSAWSSPGTSILKFQPVLNLQNFKCSLLQISNMAQSCLSLDRPGCSIEYFAPTIPPKNCHFAVQMLPKFQESSTCASHFSSTAGSAAWIVRLATWIVTRYVANCLGFSNSKCSVCKALSPKKTSCIWDAYSSGWPQVIWVTWVLEVKDVANVCRLWCEDSAPSHLERMERTRAWTANAPLFQVERPCEKEMLLVISSLLGQCHNLLIPFKKNKTSTINIHQLRAHWSQWHGNPKCCQGTLGHIGAEPSNRGLGTFKGTLAVVSCLWHQMFKAPNFAQQFYVDCHINCEKIITCCFHCMTHDYQ